MELALQSVAPRGKKLLVSGRSRGQAMVIAAASMAVLAALLALVINVGMLFAERRHLQNAADAAALAGSEQIAAEQTSRSFRDAPVLSAITTLALQNNVDVGGSRQLQATYLDQSGSGLGAVGGPPQFPQTAAGVDVQITGQLSTILPSFIGPSSIPVQAQARAGFVSLPYPDPIVNPAPFAVPLAAFQAGAAFDLYDQSVAQASYSVSNFHPFMDFANASNAGTSYQPGTDFGDRSINLQYWSDGLHNSGQLGIGDTIALAGDGFEAQVQAGLLDNVRRQGLVDGNGDSYALVDVPLWDAFTPGGVGGSDTVRIAGFARFKIVQAEITSTSLRGYFVPYLLPSSGAGTPVGALWGPAHIVMLL